MLSPCVRTFQENLLKLRVLLYPPYNEGGEVA